MENVRYVADVQDYDDEDEEVGVEKCRQVPLKKVTNKITNVQVKLRKYDPATLLPEEGDRKVRQARRAST